LRNLPHTLIESFKATLEEVSEADLLIHVVDLSHPRVDEQMAAVDSVVKELDAFGKQMLIVSTRSISWKTRTWPRSTADDFPAVLRFRRRAGKALIDLSTPCNRLLAPGGYARIFGYR